MSIIDSGIKRLASAVESNFMTKMPLYHGTNKDIKAFSLENGGAVSHSPVGKLGVSLALDPDTASEFAGLAGSEGANVIKVYHRASKPARIDLRGDELDHEVAATVSKAWDDGHDALMFTNYTTPGGQKGKKFILVKDPNQIRSVNAEFDPKKANLPDLLAGVGAIGVGVTGLIPGESAAAEINLARLQEISDRGLQDKLPKDKKDIFDEAVRRGLIKTGDFDLENFSPANFGETPMQPEAPKPAQPSGLSRAANLGLEGVASAQRAVFAIPDLVPGALNEVAALAGSEFRAPTLQGSFGEEKGAFAGEGLGTDIAAGAGEGVIMALGGAGALKRITQALPDIPANTLQRVLKEVGKFLPTTEVASGGGGGAGAVIGENEGGPTGSIIGGVAGGLTGAGVASGVGSLAKTAIDTVRGRLGRESANLIDNTGLPVPAFQKALEKKGLTFGSIVDDVDNLPVLRPGQSLDEYANQIAVRKIKQGTSDAGLADKIVKQAGRTFELANDDLAIDTIKNGWGRGYVGSAKNANDSTKNAMARMINVKRKILVDYGLPDRPLDVAGDEFFNQVKFIRTQTNRLRGELENASKELKGKQLNTAPVEEQVFKMLDDMNMQIPEEVMRDSRLLKSYLSSNEPFKSTVISPDESAKNLIRKAVNLMSDASDDAFNGHVLKKQLDNLINYNRAESKLTPKGEQFAIGLRGAVNDSIRSVSQKYAAVNDDISRALGTIESVTSTLPKSVRDNLFKTNADEALGQEIRRLETNYASRKALEDAIKNVSDTAEHFGGKFDVDLRRLANFNNALDDRFGSTAKGSLAGQQEIGTKAAIRGLNRPMEVLKDKIAEKALKMLTPTDEDALNSMHRLLMRKN